MSRTGEFPAMLYEVEIILKITDEKLVSTFVPRFSFIKNPTVVVMTENKPRPFTNISGKKKSKISSHLRQNFRNSGGLNVFEGLQLSAE